MSSLLSRPRGTNLTRHKAKNKQNNTNSLMKYHPLVPSPSVSPVPSALSVKVCSLLIVTFQAVLVGCPGFPLPA